MSFIPRMYQMLFYVFSCVVAWTHGGSITGRARTEMLRFDHGTKTTAAVRAPDTGYWHTSGNRILDAANRPVRIQGINWYGFETERAAPGGLAVQDYRTILRTIKANGYNTVRLPLSNEMVEMPRVPQSIMFENRNGAVNTSINTELRGLNSLEVLDKLVDEAGALGLKVILDNHRSEAGNSAEESGLWYTSRFTEGDWIRDWETLAERYKDNSTVIGMDLRNEPHNAAAGGSCWDCGGTKDWHLAAARGGDAVLKVNPRLLIFVEGTDEYRNDWYWWGGNLEGVRQSPVRLAVPDRLVYSAHTYGPKEYPQKWFHGSTTPESLEEVWTKHWAYVSKEGIAPVWLGEFGTRNGAADLEDGGPGSEGQWFQSLVAFLAKTPELNWTVWALNGEDADGLLNANYDAPANLLKQRAIASIMRAPVAAPVHEQRLVAQVMTPAVTLERLAYVRQKIPAYVPMSIATPPSMLAAPAPVTRVTALPKRESSSCRVTYQSEKETAGGFKGLIEIENAGNTAIDGWTLLWQYGDGQEISRASNVLFAQHGELVMMTNTGLNKVIPAGAKLSGITFRSRYRGRNRRPDRFYLNGSLCG